MEPNPDKSEETPDNQMFSAPPSEERFGRANWILFLMGCVLMFSGYAALACAGRMGTNVFGRVAPFLVVGGLVVFGLGFVPRAKGE